MNEYLTLKLFPTDDQELTCFICRGTGCDREFTVKGGGIRSWIGVHSRCVIQQPHPEIPARRPGDPA
jgi:hypothetical protein